MPLKIFKIVKRQFKMRPTFHVLKGFEGTQVGILICVVVIKTGSHMKIL